MVFHVLTIVLRRAPGIDRREIAALSWQSGMPSAGSCSPSRPFRIHLLYSVDLVLLSLIVNASPLPYPCPGCRESGGRVLDALHHGVNFVQGSKPMDIREVGEVKDIHEGGFSHGLGNEASPVRIGRGRDGPGHIFGFAEARLLSIFDESDRSARRLAKLAGTCGRFGRG